MVVVIYVTSLGGMPLKEKYPHTSLYPASKTLFYGSTAYVHASILQQK